MLVAGLLVGAGAFALAGLVPSFWFLVAMFAVAGLGNTVYHPADYSILSHHVSAQRMGQASRSAYFNSTTGAINDEGYWDFELVDALDDLYMVDHNPAWVNANVGAMN